MENEPRIDMEEPSEVRRRNGPERDRDLVFLGLLFREGEFVTWEEAGWAELSIDIPHRHSNQRRRTQNSLQDKEIIEVGSFNEYQQGRPAKTYKPDYEYVLQLLEEYGKLDARVNREKAVRGIKTLYTSPVVRESVLNPTHENLNVGDKKYSVEGLVEEGVETEKVWKIYSSFLLHVPLLLMVYRAMETSYTPDWQESLTLKVVSAEIAERDPELASLLSEEQHRLKLKFTRETVGEKTYKYISELYGKCSDESLKDLDEALNLLGDRYVANIFARLVRQISEKESQKRTMLDELSEKEGFEMKIYSDFISRLAQIMDEEDLTSLLK